MIMVSLSADETVFIASIGEILKFDPICEEHKETEEWGFQ